ncbi:anti-sigma factor [Sphingomonas sp.]|jgi:anti-sigma-K factor RskA|uniref:anti-sigma factor n=1 Tax=Sphingomonas sp. TaxID=28214 RepID=UPI002D7E889D|nr:anti-sigma factor [Sphingomonas sp.]HEU0045270.1 anti-sigma factor [Sphingomonas sp.]
MTEGEHDMTAAELALGLLEGDERAAAMRRVLSDRAFAAEVEWWRAEFAVMFETMPDTQPAAHVFERVERSLDAPATPRQPNRLWPAIAGLTSMAAAAMLALMVLRPEPAPVVPQAPALLAAAITPTKAGEPLSAVYDERAGTLRLSAAVLADARHSAELWVIGGDGVPHSLGILRPGGVTALPIAPSDRARIAAAAVLAVTVEPLGGSPSGAPTGPIVAKGALART